MSKPRELPFARVHVDLCMRMCMRMDMGSMDVHRRSVCAYTHAHMRARACAHARMQNATRNVRT